jgi:DNA-binding MarR family transcriptional regulator
MTKINRQISKYEALSEFRYLMLRFLARSATISRSIGISQKQYLLLLSVHGFPRSKPPNIKIIAERLQVTPNSAVDFVKRACRKGLVRKTKTSDDERQVLILLTTKGEQMVNKIAHEGIAEIKTYGPDLIRALRDVIKNSND